MRLVVGPRVALGAILFLGLVTAGLLGTTAMVGKALKAAVP